MIKSFLNGVIGGFSRTLGRILFYIFVALIFYFIFGLKNVDALEQIGEFQMTTPYDSPCGSGASGYCAIQTNQSVYTRSLNTTYNGVLQCINFEVNYTFNSNYQYNLYLEGMSSDFRNNSLNQYVYGYHNSPSQSNVVSTTLKFVSKSKLQISFPKGVSYSHYPVTICGSPLTGISNYGIKKAYLKYDDGQQDIGGVIENNNTNTQNIIENNNSNTQDIINNQNENQQQTNELLGFCFKNLFNYNAYNNSVSQLQKNNNNGFTITGDYYAVDSGITLSSFCPSCQVGKTYFLNAQSNSPDSKFSYLSLSGYTWQFGTSKTLSQTDLNSTLYFYNRWEHSSSDVTSINNIMITEQNISTFGEYNKQVCTSKLDAVDSGINNLNNTLTSQSPIDSSIFSTWWTNFTENQFSNPLGNLITLPINLVQKLINYSSSACQPVQLGSLLGTNLTLTCFTLGDYITNSSVLNIIDLIMSLSLIAFTLKNAYETVSNLISLGGENEVKQHFKFPTPMEFIAFLFGGGR